MYGLESEKFSAKLLTFLPEGVVVCAALKRAGNSVELICIEIKCSQLLFLSRQNLKLNNFKVSCESIWNISQ